MDQKYHAFGGEWWRDDVKVSELYMGYITPEEAWRLVTTLDDGWCELYKADSDGNLRLMAVYESYQEEPEGFRWIKNGKILEVGFVWAKKQ